MVWRIRENKMAKQGFLWVISGPSGVGKGTICQLLRERDPVLQASVSATTRKPRPGEVEGINYFFLSREEFWHRREAGEFLEWAEVYGNYYGTPRDYVTQVRKRGQDVILEIDTQGAMQVKAACPDGVFIFILPPSLAELERRIVGRGTETPESLQRRISQATGELALAGRYHYQVVNDEVERAVEEIASIMAKVRAEA